MQDVEELMKLKRTRLAPGSSESTSNQATTSARNSPMSAITPPLNHSRGAYSSLSESERPADDFPSDVTIPRLHPPALRFSAPSPTFPGPTSSSEKLIACHQYSRAIRVLAVLDAVVVLYGASAFTPLILMLWGPVAGYVSSTFRLKAAKAFLFYYGLRVCWDIGWLLTGGITWIVVWVFLVTDAAASGLVYLYLGLLRKCTPSEIEQLRDPNASWASAFFPFTSSGTISSNPSVP